MSGRAFGLTAYAHTATIENQGISRLENMEQDLQDLEAKVSTLIAHTYSLRAANDALRQELAAALSDNRDLHRRVTQAGVRLDALLARMPAE